jgi:hypothetical protein
MSAYFSQYLFGELDAVEIAVSDLSRIDPTSIKYVHLAIILMAFFFPFGYGKWKGMEMKCIIEIETREYSHQAIEGVKICTLLVPSFGPSSLVTFFAGCTFENRDCSI